MLLDFTAQTGPDHHNHSGATGANPPSVQPEDVQPEDVLEVYEAIEACSAGMLLAAQSEDWAAVARIKTRCDALIESARAAGPTGHWPREWRNARLRVLGRVLRNEAQLRRLAFAQARQTDALLAGMA